MIFENIAEAFNYYNERSDQEIEERKNQILLELDKADDNTLELLNIEIDGIKQALTNHDEKKVEKENSDKAKDELRSKLAFNPITKEQNTKGDDNMTDIFSTPEYRNAFYKLNIGKPLEAEERDILDKAKAELRATGFNTSTDNALVIPTETLNEVIAKASTQGGLLGEARAFNIPAYLRIPIGTPLSQAEWHTEGAEVEAEKSVPTEVEFKANELLKLFAMSYKAKTMSIPQFENYMKNELVTSVMGAIEKTLVSGSGKGQGKGLESAAIPKVEYKELAYTDFTNAVAKLKRGYAKGAKFAMNNATLFSQVYSIVDGNKRPIFISDPKNESIGRILGFEVVIDDNIADGDIYLGNFSQYLGYNLPNGIMLESSDISGFNKGLTYYRALALADTQVILPEAFVKLAKGGEI